MSILASLFKRFTKRKPEPIRHATEITATPPEIIDGWNPPADPEPVKPATSPERLEEIREDGPFWGKEVGDRRFDLLYICFCDRIATKEDMWNIKTAAHPEIAKDLTPETVKQATEAALIFPVDFAGHHVCPPGFIIPPAK